MPTPDTNTVIRPALDSLGPLTLQNAASDGSGAALDAAGLGEIALMLTFSDDVASGSVQIETAITPDSEAWASLADPIVASPGGVEQVTVPGPLAYVRARITNSIVGGTVTVVAFVTF
jgi:hypothetical protein